MSMIEQTAYPVAPADAPQTRLSDMLAGTRLIGEYVVRVFTPKGLSPVLGEILAVLPFLVLYLPVVWSTWGVTSSVFHIGLGILMALMTSIVLALILYGKRKIVQIGEILETMIVPGTGKSFHRSLGELFAPHTQLLMGGIIAVTFIFVAATQSLITQSSWPYKILGILSFTYIGMIWGTGLYAVLSIPQFLKDLSAIEFRIKALFPFQQYELRRISEIATSITTYGIWFATGIISLLVAVQFAVALRYQGPLRDPLVFLGVVEILILFVALIVVSIPFFSFHAYLSQKIKKAKAERIMRLSAGLEGLIDKAEQGDPDAAANILKLQTLIDQVDKSPDTVLEVASVGKFFTTILLTIIPILIGSFVR